MNLIEELKYLKERVNQLEETIGVTPPVKEDIGIKLSINKEDVLHVAPNGDIRVDGQPCTDGSKIIEVLRRFVKARSKKVPELSLIDMKPKGEA